MCFFIKRPGKRNQRVGLFKPQETGIQITQPDPVQVVSVLEDGRHFPVGMGFGNIVHAMISHGGKDAFPIFRGNTSSFKQCPYPGERGKMVYGILPVFPTDAVMLPADIMHVRGRPGLRGTRG